ncbi:trifunctional transcriptional regulator/proline dehydrogenase/L-glutamate gamma-semialdehyde dehydrogenase [Ottowia caeni]|uniref:trifunctional transcriptional regulator/proline dehydrogenase/L-glutamate gamma-semialdehyde dehydrogenase n=1 Tax=Ottowia caeni TaxID=2870339 RepID=UPI001E406D66|nr:trifunctional transcriptional regulator/proline dehydrogenase/L-glutamate gamma-semialdehyde dehydrogenase [Ottowia caeni]
MQSSANIFQDFFQPSSLASSPRRRAVTAAWRISEADAVSSVLPGARVGPDQADRIQQLAGRVARTLRQRKARVARASLVQSLLQEYSLSSQEGVALMCLAEALLRIPDTPTRDALIRDKISQGQWSTHLGQSSSLFVNAATWGLLITGKLVSTHSESKLTSALGRLVGMGGEPLIRKGVDMAMRMMGEQFVTGETIDEALKNGSVREQQGFRYSFDMLGEAALTARDAQRYLSDYENAIKAIGMASAGRGVYAGPGISIKLSALHPRYSRAQYDRVLSELYPALVRLCAAAKRYDIGLNIDAEEADRLELSLDLLEKLCFEPQLQGWNGLGFVIQGYQKRCPYVIDYLIDLARRSQRRLMVRLVKGAYWDSEIKRAQVDGLNDYPVYTRKPHTDAAYIACARKLLAAPDEVFPQFATHNAQTLATIYELADPARYTPLQYEFQCLHGMGEPLYEQVVGDEAHRGLGRPCRIYAPVGTHETLLAYLVRRLLENGANTSFVHQIADPDMAIETLVQDPVAAIEQSAASEGQVGSPHPAISLPNDLYGPLRRNSKGYDLASESELLSLSSELDSRQDAWEAWPMLTFETHGAEATPVCNPALNHDRVGSVRAATLQEVDGAISAAAGGAAAWAEVAPGERARLLELTAEGLEANLPRLMSILIREAGKSAANAVAEVREAVDFLRFYALEVRSRFDNRTHVPLGPVVCISPWNFPLAIFVGQVAAALAAGNVVLAKPAEQTPLVAAEAVRTMWEAGVPRSAVQLLPGDGPTVGARLVADERVQGVLFTGSTEVARILQMTLAARVNVHGRAIPLIAETGGQNAMIVDSSALAEQVVGDVLVSAFDSAGQRCSALRVLCVQEDAADRVLDMLLGAMAELRVGSPAQLQTDVGPVIDAQAQQSIEHHIETMQARGHRVHRVHRTEGGSRHALSEGTFVLPTLIEIDRIAELKREVFGPVLHFVRYKRDQLDVMLAQINATGYGLTMGLHTRIDETIVKVVGASRAGNVYVNRNMVGAVVGVQPFGGEGLSGTGPKAGGPLYLYRLLGAAPSDVLSRVTDSTLTEANTNTHDRAPGALRSLQHWANLRGDSELVRAVQGFQHRGPKADTIVLPGPTGERNVYSLHGRTGVVCMAERNEDLLVQLAAVLAVGGQAIWPASAQPLLSSLPSDVQALVAVAAEPLSEGVHFDAVLLHGTTDELAEVQRKLVEREGPVISVERLDSGDANVPLERLVVERALSINTAAAGGNASLMTIG